LENGFGKTGVLGKNPRDFLRGQFLAAAPQGAIENLEQPI
jgi:hypothetical protein